MAAPKVRIRKSTFSIYRRRREPCAVCPMLDQAVKYLSAELYTKDIHLLSHGTHSGFLV
jgi:sacsin